MPMFGQDILESLLMLLHGRRDEVVAAAPAAAAFDSM